MASGIQRADEERHNQTGQSGSPGDPYNAQVTNKDDAQQDIHERLADKDWYQTLMLIDPDHRGRHDLEAGERPNRESKHRQYRTRGPRVLGTHPDPDERRSPELECKNDR